MQVDLMLLDEPTNHLDFQSVEWRRISEILQGTVIVVSHDRYFLDQTVTRIIELENRTAKVYGKLLVICRTEGACAQNGACKNPSG